MITGSDNDFKSKSVDGIPNHVGRKQISKYPVTLKTNNKVKFQNQKSRLISTMYFLAILEDSPANDDLGLLVFRGGGG